MKNTQQVENSTQGADSQTPTQAQVIEFLDRDLGLAIRCLQGIHQNKNLKAQLADWMVGEIENYKAAKVAAETNPKP